MPREVILWCGFRCGFPRLLSLMRDVILKQDGSGLILYLYAALGCLDYVVNFIYSVMYIANITGTIGILIKYGVL